jgi:hypothetical protein
MNNVISKNKIETWKQFRKKIRSKGCCLLKNLENYPNSIMVTGCQRSGTTILSRVINKSPEVVDYWRREDDELDAALILCGYEKPDSIGRYCFQTTYLNECYYEYFNHQNNDHKIIWVLRNPFSVVYSMLFNWSRFALNELFLGCGLEFLDEKDRRKLVKYGPWAIKRIKKACYAYNGKTKQIHHILNVLRDDTIMVVLYDDMVNNPAETFMNIFDFLGMEYDNRFINDIHNKSVGKKNQLSINDKKYVKKICESTYSSAKKVINIV